MNVIRIGVLYSTDGPYGAMGRDCRDGALLAIEALNREGRIAQRIEPVFGNPRGQADLYLEQARHMLRDAGCRHIIGTVISLSRKDVIPLIEKYDGLLWYVCPYEGFEANESVIYTGGCPNQHLVPLFDHLLPQYGGGAYLTGANYVWGWEMNRLARELVVKGGGQVLGERYLPLEETDVARLIADIAEKRPSFVLNTLIGPSSYAFLKGMRDLAASDPAFRPERCPVVSCDLTECELDAVSDAGIGQLSVAAYFDGVATSENFAFKTMVAARFGISRQISSFFAGAYTATRMCVEAIAMEGTDDPVAVRKAIQSGPHLTVLGPMEIDHLTNHAALPFHLGRINGARGFDIIDSRQPIAADPYLIEPAQPRRTTPHLRLVR